MTTNPGLADDAVLRRWTDRIAAARADGGKLAIRGGASKRFFGAAPHGEAFDTTELRGITAYEPSELVITARAGTPLAELEAALQARGQCLPFEPPRFGSGRTGSVGGMVAAGWAGPARWTAGSVRDHVLGATLLNGKGELLQFGGQVIKNVAGYDVSRLLAGSMGVLGVLCEVSLKVLPAAPAQRTLRFEAPQADALRRLNEWAGRPLPLSASAWWQGMLVVRLAGAAPAVRHAAERMGGEAVEADLAQAFWDGLRDQTDEFFTAAAKAITAQRARLWRVSVPATAPGISLPGDELVEWGGALRWWLTDQPAAAVHDAASGRGGHALLWRGAPAAGETALPVVAPPIERLHRRLKDAFDPDHVFNPGRLLAGL